MTWNVPVKDICPECGKTMFKLSGKGQRKPFCINEACVNFVPEDKRGYKRKKPAENADGAATEEAKTEDASTEQPKAEKKAAAKKTATKKSTAAKKTTTTKKSTTAKKTTKSTGKTAEKADK
jgi:DNA topoisomerase-1